MIRYIFISFLISFCIYSQELNDKFFIHPVIKFGTMFSGINYWEFTASYSYEDDFRSINPNIFIGGGIETRNINIGWDASLTFRSEISYGKAKTTEITVRGDKADFQVTSIPIMFWIKLKSNGKLSPFIKIGAGAEKSEFVQSYHRLSVYSFNAEDWFFCYGIGAGIEFNLHNNFSISLFVDALTKEDGFIIEILRPEQRTINYDLRNSVVNCGFEFAYLF
jgi:hypothetical protein